MHRVGDPLEVRHEPRIRPQALHLRDAREGQFRRAVFVSGGRARAPGDGEALADLRAKVLRGPRVQDELIILQRGLVGVRHDRVCERARRAVCSRDPVREVD